MLNAMAMKSPLLMPCCVLALLCGCESAPPAAGEAVSAYYVGDRAHVSFDEVVVSLPLRGASAPYQNLHVSVAAVVNPRKTSWSSSYDVQGILRRVEHRIAARLSEVLSGLGEQSLSDAPALRRKIVAEAQPLVDEALRQWEHGSDYRVEMVVESLYWTDASVGRMGRQRTFSWD